MEDFNIDFISLPHTNKHKTMAEGRFAVIGMGRFGSAIAQRLTEKGAEVIAMDASRERIEHVRDKVTYAVALDSTDKDALVSQGIKDMDAVVVALGENFQDVLLTTFVLQELGVKRIIVRANGDVQTRILEKMGVKEILSPEAEVSNAVADNLINPHVLMTVTLPDSYQIIEVKAPKGIAGRTLSEIGLREKYKVNLVTLLRWDGTEQPQMEYFSDNTTDVHHHIIGVPTADTVIEESDILLLFGTGKSIQRFIDINS